MKKIFRNTAFWHIAIGVIIIAICWACGFRITYSPDIDYNWDAIGAVASLVGTVIVPFAVIWLQRKWDNDKQDIANSNMALLEEMRRTQEKMQEEIRANIAMFNALLGNEDSYEPWHDIRENIQKYIKIAITPTTKEIADFIGMSQESLLPILKEMKEQRIIWTKSVWDDISDPECRWKLVK